jgi:hypothetical protein
MVYDVSLYEELFDKLSLAISNLESQGYDTTSLEASYDQASDAFEYAKVTTLNSDFIIAFNLIGPLITAINTFISTNQVYIGSHDCCCVIAEPSNSNNNTDVDLTWVWLVSSKPKDSSDEELLPLVPYYAGIGKKPQTSVVCAIRNPNEDGETEVLIKSLSYPSNSSCATIIQERINSWDGTIPWESTTDGFSIIPYTSCEERKTITCPCKPREGVCDVELIECSEITEEDLNYFINLKHVNPFNNCEVVWKWIVQEVGNSSNRVELPAGTGLIAQNKLNHGVLSGKNYRIQLTYDHTDGNDGLIVFDQTLFVPYCPQFDMTSTVSFTDTSYGSKSTAVVLVPEVGYVEPIISPISSWVSSLPFVGTVSDEEGALVIPESDSDEDPSTLAIRRLIVGDTNPYGEFTVTLQHNPDTNNQYWNALAANIADYQWKWIFNIRDSSDNVIYSNESIDHPTSSGKVSQWQFNINLLDEGIVSAPNNFTYRAQLQAYKDGDLIKQGNLVTGQNNKHKGTRTVQSIDETSNTNHTFNLGLIGGSGTVYRELQYRPLLNFVGLHNESYAVTFEYENGNTETLTKNIIFDVREYVTVIYDVQGGEQCTPSYNYLEYNQPYGTLCTPTKLDSNFLGWYTEPNGQGTQITPSTIITNNSDHTIYAHWYTWFADVQG